MSDETTHEPSAEETPAPVETKDPAAEPTKPAAKPRTPDDDFEDLLKKSGGLKYRAAGKEKTITTAAELKRILSRVDGTEQAASAALKERTEASALKAKISSLDKLPLEQWADALAEIGIPLAKVNAMVERRIIADDEKQQAQKDMTPSERELRQQLAERDAELAKHESARQQWEREQAEEKEAAQAGQLYERISSVAAKALQASKIAPEHVNRFLPAIAEEIDRNERLGLEYDENDIASTVLKQHGSLARDYYSGLDLDTHLDELRAMEMPDPANPGKKTTRLKLMMRAEAARIRGEKSGPAPVVRQARAEQTGQAIDPIDAARTFGGGVAY